MFKHTYLYAILHLSLITYYALLMLFYDILLSSEFENRKTLKLFID